MQVWSRSLTLEQFAPLPQLETSAADFLALSQLDCLQGYQRQVIDPQQVRVNVDS